MPLAFRASANAVPRLSDLNDRVASRHLRRLPAPSIRERRNRSRTPSATESQRRAFVESRYSLLAIAIHLKDDLVALSSIQAIVGCEFTMSLEIQKLTFNCKYTWAGDARRFRQVN